MLWSDNHINDWEGVYHNHFSKPNIDMQCCYFHEWLQWTVVSVIVWSRKPCGKWFVTQICEWIRGNCVRMCVCVCVCLHSWVMYILKSTVGCVSIQSCWVQVVFSHKPLVSLSELTDASEVFSFPSCYCEKWYQLENVMLTVTDIQELWKT